MIFGARKAAGPVLSLYFRINGFFRTFPVPAGPAGSCWKVLQVGILICVVLLCLWVPTVQGSDGELCVVETPLKSPYFIPYVSTPLLCPGCAFPSDEDTQLHRITFRTPSGKDAVPSSVHVIQVGSPQAGVFEITLQGSPDGSGSQDSDVTKTADDVTSDAYEAIYKEAWVVMLLSPGSPQAPPLSYVLYGDSRHQNLSLLLLLRPSDTVDLTGMPNKSRVDVGALNTTDDVMDSAKQAFGFVSSFTKALGVNSIVLNLQKDVPEPSEGKNCSEEFPSQSPVARCFNVVKKQTAGCYHEGMVGATDRAIHIIEIKTSSNETLASVILRLKGFSEPIPTQSYNLDHKSTQPEPRSEGSIPIKRNLTLVLRGSQPTFWKLTVANLQGFITLLVGPEDQVENKSSSGSGVNLQVKRTDLPKSFDQLILRVLTSIGPPISYTNTRHPDIITVLVAPSRELPAVRPSVPLPAVPEELPAVPDVRGEIAQSFTDESPESLIDKHTRTECRNDHVIVTLPIWVGEQLGGVTITLRDPVCRGVKNGTHFVLVAHYSECGFVQEVTLTDTVYTNFAHIHVGGSGGSLRVGITDDEDFEGSGYEAYENQYKVRIPTLVVLCKKPYVGATSRHFEGKVSTTSLENAVRYNMAVFRDKTFNVPFREFPVLVPEEGTIYTKISFAKDVSPHLIHDLNLKLLVEKCWLGSSNSKTENRFVLLQKSCAVDESIRVEREPLAGDIQFSFQPSRLFLQTEKTALYCQVGVCSRGSLPKPAAKKCVDPASYCAKHSLVDVFTDQVVASHIITLMIGPFLLQPSKEALSSLRFENEKMLSRGKEVTAPREKSVVTPSSGRNKTPIIVMEGLSTEVVVAIALASFVIGVCVTATLWVIYMKTDPHRQKHPESEVPRNSGYDLSAHSGSSTPSSQAPMTA